MSRSRRRAPTPLIGERPAWRRLCHPFGPQALFNEDRIQTIMDHQSLDVPLSVSKFRYGGDPIAPESFTIDAETILYPFPAELLVNRARALKINRCFQIAMLLMNRLYSSCDRCRTFSMPGKRPSATSSTYSRMAATALWLNCR